MVLRQHQADGRDEQQHREDVGNPLKAFEQRDAGDDKRGPHDDSAEDTPEQHPSLPHALHREGLEEEQEDEQVVDGERLFKRVAGDELRAEPMVEREIQVGREAKRAQQPHGGGNVGAAGCLLAQQEPFAAQAAPPA